MLNLLHPSRSLRRNQASAKGEHPEQRSPPHMCEQQILLEIRLIWEAGCKRRRQMRHSKAKLKEKMGVKRHFCCPGKDNATYSQQEELNHEGESAMSK